MCRVHCSWRSGEEENIKTYKENKNNIFTYFCRCGRRSIETLGPYCSDGRANQTKNCDRYLTIKREKKRTRTHTRVVLLDWPARSPTPTRIHTQTCALSSHADNGKKYII